MQFEEVLAGFPDDLRAEVERASAYYSEPPRPCQVYWYLVEIPDIGPPVCRQFTDFRRMLARLNDIDGADVSCYVFVGSAIPIRKGADGENRYIVLDGGREWPLRLAFDGRIISGGSQAETDVTFLGQEADELGASEGSGGA